MKKILLACFILYTFYFILPMSSVLAVCIKDPSQFATGNNLGCNSPLTCQRLTFPAANGPLCKDPNASDCWCASNDPNYTPPPVPTSSPSPTVSSFTLPSSLPIACNSSNPGDKDSRPVPCDSCTQTTLLTPACASNFSLIDSVNYQKSDPGIMCNNQHWLEREWSGTITVDANNTKVPFVGKKGQESEQKYLADYFEGTKYYTATSQDPILTAGVWPKLAPLELQDDFKKQMIDRAAKGEIHDYQIEYNNESAKLTEFSGHLPPKANDPTYSSWQKSKWGKLWPAVPMFSKEDTPGEITPELGIRPSDTFNKKVQLDKVPHLARLYELTKSIQSLLIPLSSPNPTPTPVSQNTGIYALTQAEIDSFYSEKSFAYSEKSFAYADKDTVGQVLGREAPFYGCKFYYGNNSDPRDCSCMGRIKPDGTNECRAEDPNQQCCPNHGFFGICGWGDCKLDGPDAHCQSKNIPENGCPFIDIIDYPAQPPPKPAPICGLGGPKDIPNCSPKEALTDSNPNDTICCQTPLKMSFTGVDTFVNNDYVPWQNCLSGCDDRYAQGIIKTEKQYQSCLSNCDGTVSEKVSRGMAIGLQHPYLKEIWQQTTDSLAGFLNIFRPGTTELFKETPAKSTIDYSFTDPKNPAAHAETTPGDFYFPYLGGIQEAKEFVINLLNPSGKSFIGSNGGGTSNPSPTPKPITLDYVIQHRNSSTISISAELKKRIIDNVHANSNWDQTTKIDSSFDFVYNQAIANNWNPAFVIALWIEESGAGAFDSAYALGCEGAAKTDLAGQLNCLFARPYADKSFEEFMCRYSDGHYPCDFSAHPNFVAGIKTWYNCTTGVSCPYK